jgi:trans-aconitate methyltransferase
MDSWITAGDFIETAIKIRQRGLPFILSKFSLNAEARTLSAFQPEFEHANWWIIPAIQKRLNLLATENANESYESYLAKKYIRTGNGILISPGCGTGGHERKIALACPNLSVTGFDLSPDLIHEARQETQSKGIPNVTFETDSIYTRTYAPESVDYFLFHASLHHFNHIESLLNKILMPALKPQGMIFLHEYTGPDRMLLAPEQLNAAQEALRKLPTSARKILGTNWTKNNIYGHGKLRMMISDPSECVQSSEILPVFHKYLTVVEEKKLGGNLLVPVLKHIAHHFVNGFEKELQALMQTEDEYLKKNPSDFIFGIYQKS